MIYNPFDVSKYTDEIIVERIKNLIDRCDDNADSVSGMTENVMNLTDVLYLYGELLTRAQKEYSLLKFQNNTKEVQLAYTLKKNTQEKFPISYFNALAQQQMMEDRTREIELQQNANRFKYAYDATQEKINAIKKKIEATKYEFGLY